MNSIFQLMTAAMDKADHISISDDNNQVIVTIGKEIIYISKKLSGFTVQISVRFKNIDCWVQDLRESDELQKAIDIWDDMLTKSFNHHEKDTEKTVSELFSTLEKTTL